MSMTPELSREFNESKAEVAKEILLTSGVIECMVKTNPWLVPRLADFLIGYKRVLVIGGESGMGKSLLGTGITLIHKDISANFPPLATPLVIVSWDRVHEIFFEQISKELGHKIPLPKGETHPDIRSKASQTMRDTVRFATENLAQNSRIIVEGPLFGLRGEHVVFDNHTYRENMQVLIMHSPKLRREVLEAGRLKETSGQPQAMESMRRNLLSSIVGDVFIKLSEDEQEEVIKNYWLNFLTVMDGAVIDWDPDTINVQRTKYNSTIQRFKDNKLDPDRVYPDGLDKFVVRHVQSIFETIDNLTEFLSKAEDKTA